MNIFDLVKNQINLKENNMLADSLRGVLKKKLASLGIKLSELSEKIGKDRTYVSRILMGKKELGLDELEVIAKAINLTPVELIFEASNTFIKDIELNQDQENLILESDDSFLIWSLLDIELSQKDILNRFKNESKVLVILKNFIDKGIISETKPGFFKRNHPHEYYVLYSDQKKINKRRFSILQKAIKSKPDLKNLSNKKREEWLSTQTDMFFMGYFTKEQLLERKGIIKKTLLYIADQYSITNYEEMKKNNELKFHVFSFSDMEVPLS